jgi:hypothetical protein
MEIASVGVTMLQRELAQLRRVGMIGPEWSRRPSSLSRPTYRVQLLPHAITEPAVIQHGRQARRLVARATARGESDERRATSDERRAWLVLGQDGTGRSSTDLFEATGIANRISEPPIRSMSGTRFRGTHCQDPGLAVGRHLAGKICGQSVTSASNSSLGGAHG